MIFIKPKIKTNDIKRLIIVQLSLREILTPILEPIILAKNAIGIIANVTCPSANLLENAKNAWIKTNIVIVGKSAFVSFPIKHFSAVANSTAPPIPIEELIAPISANVI